MISWKPIETAPKDKKGFLGWHKLWKTPISVRFLSGENSYSGENCFIEKTLTAIWPLESFSHWTELPDGPLREKEDIGD